MQRQALAELGILRSTYYTWRQRQRRQILEARSRDRRPWNRLTLEEDGKMLVAAWEAPELSTQQLAAWITDHAGFAASESTVYRIFKREGLIKRPELMPAMQFAAHRYAPALVLQPGQVVAHLGGVPGETRTLGPLLRR